MGCGLLGLRDTRHDAAGRSVHRLGGQSNPSRVMKFFITVSLHELIFGAIFLGLVGFYAGWWLYDYTRFKLKRLFKRNPK